jgi:anti-sigma factor RsiW
MVEIMSLRLFASDDPVHSEVAELLPWYVNGTLKSQEHDLVARHLTECKACHQEIQMLSRLQADVSEAELDVDMGASLTRVRQRIEHAAQPQRSPLAWLVDHWRRLERPVRHVLATQTALVAMLLMMVGWLVYTPAPSADFHVLGAHSSLSSSVRAQIVVVFAQDVTERQMRAMLLRLGANVVHGPTTEGAYVLAVNAGQRADVLADLKQQDGVVFAEPADGTALAVP